MTAAVICWYRLWISLAKWSIRRASVGGGAGGVAKCVDRQLSAATDEQEVSQSRACSRRSGSAAKSTILRWLIVGVWALMAEGLAAFSRLARRLIQRKPVIALLIETIAVASGPRPRTTTSRPEGTT